MRLLKTRLISEPGAIEIEEFDDISTPTYAILSHRWGNDEPTLQDVKRGTTAKDGFKKIQQSCDMAKRDGIDYIWIDTCCIDKSSSAELSEAINSMYLWYFKAHRCYAYLADVPSKLFEESEWFTRGWTLQELLAPADLVFFDANWKSLGTKESLQKEISSCTGIPVDILSGNEDLETCSVAQRMSWAAKRDTKRVEDIAYCLLGIFGINMPLLYGEGERAFIRLQEEIMRVSDDHSLFAWESIDNRGGLLATSPAAFEGSGNIVPLSNVDDSHNTLTISSRGVHLDFRLIGKGSQKLGLAMIQCQERNGPNNQIAIYLTDLTGTMQTFRRVRSYELKRLDLTKTRSSQYLMRRACIQSGRMIPTRGPKRGIDDIKTYEPHDDVVWESLISRPQPLSHAAQKGDQDDVWLMLTRRDIDINSKGIDGWSALFHAVNNGYEVIVKMLLALGANIDLADRDSYTPLLLAVEKGYEDIVKLLLERGAGISMDVDNESNVWKILQNTVSLEDEILFQVMDELKVVKHGRWPVFLWAAKNQQENIIKLLLDRSPEIYFKIHYGPALLRWAAKGGHNGVAEWLIDRGVEVNCKNHSYQDIMPGSIGMTPASIASLYGNEDTLELLLKKGASIEAKDDHGQMLLLLAAEQGHNHTIRLLLEKQANVNAKNGKDQTPLSLAVEQMHYETAKLLLENGADIEAKDRNDRTSLSLAVGDYKNKRGDTVKLLLDNGANIEAGDVEGETPLLRAVRTGAELAVKLLIDKGANIMAKDKKGRTPLSLAAKRGEENILRLLLEKGADLEAKDNNGRTSLSWAAAGYRTEETIALLLRKGADIEAKDHDGRAPLSWGASKNRVDNIKLLLAKGAYINAADNSGRTALSWATKHVAKLLVDEGAIVEIKKNSI